MRTTLLIAACVSAVLAVKMCEFTPPLPTCPYGGPNSCAYLWVGNYVPSTSAPTFDFYLDQQVLTDAQGVPYGRNFIVAVDCAGLNETSHTLGLGDPLLGGEIASTRQSLLQGQLDCGIAFSFFAARAQNQQQGNTQVEKYRAAGRLLVGANNYFSGLVFNGIYRGNDVKGRYCRFHQNTGPNQCTRDPDEGRDNNFNVGTTTWGEMQMREGPGYENPVTLSTNGGQNVFYDQYVEGDIGQCAVWIFYGDNQAQDQFPLAGGVSSGSLLSSSLSLLVLLGVTIKML